MEWGGGDGGKGARWPTENRARGEKKKKKEMPAFHKFHGKIKYHSKKKTVAVWLRINDRLLGSGFSAWTVTVMTKCNSMETLKIDRKIKRNNTGLLQVWGGVWGVGEYTVMCVKMVKLNRRQVIKDMCFTVLIRQ